MGLYSFGTEIPVQNMSKTSAFNQGGSKAVKIWLNSFGTEIRGQNMSKTSALNQGGGVKMGLNSFGTRILEVC